MLIFDILLQNINHLHVNASVLESRTRPRVGNCWLAIYPRAFFVSSFSLFDAPKHSVHSPLSFDISSFSRHSRTSYHTSDFSFASSPHNPQSTLREQKMRPTSILAGASRIPLTGKRGNKDFYKGQPSLPFVFFSLHSYAVMIILTGVINYRYWPIKGSRSWSPNGCSWCARRSWEIQVQTVGRPS